MLLRLLAPIAALLLVLACSPGGSSVPQPAPQGGAAQTEGDTGGDPDDSQGEDDSDGDDDATVTVQADAEVTGQCRPRPRDTDDGAQLLAKVKVANTGDLGVKVRIAARWPQLQGQGIIRWKRVNVEQGDTRELTMRLGITDAEAKAIRKAIDAERTCSVQHRIIGAYGD